jgi:mono/diheme cytochrome c family protein
MTAMALAVAVVAVTVVAVAAVRSNASPVAPTRELAAELLIARGDLDRLDNEQDLSRENREGLTQRIAGALGLLPFLLRQAGDAPGAERLRLWQQRPLANAAERAALIAALDAAIARFPIDHDAFRAPKPTPARISEARAIHETYCAGCHDGVGQGAADALLPPRDLFLMARQEPPDIFLARLINGVKGDASIQFANPLTDAQIGALSSFYRNVAP